MTTHVNTIHHVTTITQVAKDLGEHEDCLRDSSIEMEIEDGSIWVNGVGEDGVKAFTDFGIENLIELFRIYKENPGLLKRCPVAYAEWIRTIRSLDNCNSPCGDRHRSPGHPTQIA
jgi:hypothetical protein